MCLWFCYNSVLRSPELPYPGVCILHGSSLGKAETRKSSCAAFVGVCGVNAPTSGRRRDAAGSPAEARCVTGSRALEPVPRQAGVVSGCPELSSREPESRDLRAPISGLSGQRTPRRVVTARPPHSP
ncbi:uncharacterized protein ACBT57_014644 [Dama dama]